jgi:hypothetical protein
MSSFGHPQPFAQTGPGVQSGPFQLNGQEIGLLIQQVQHGDFNGIQRFLAETRAKREWDDRCFVLGEVSEYANPEILIAACAANPDDPALHLLLGSNHVNMARKSRGAAQAENTTAEQFAGASMHIKGAQMCLNNVIYLDPDDPTPHALLSNVYVIFTDYLPQLKEEYQIADRIAPSFVSLQSNMVNAMSEKWYGSHAESLAIARAALRKGKPGDDMPACLFLAHYHGYQYHRAFEKDKERALAYLKDTTVMSELNSVFDRWTDQMYRPRRSSIRYLHRAAMWYFLTQDRFRLRRALDLTCNIPCNDIWKQIGTPEKKYAAALQMAYGQPPTPAPQPPKPEPQQKRPGLFGFLKKP